MKKALLTLALVALATFVNAQGTIQFANNAGTRFNVNGVRPVNASLGGPAAGLYTFGCFYGTTEVAARNATQTAAPLGANTAVGGLITVANANAFQLPGTDAGQTVFIQFRAWESRFGADFSAAKLGGLYAETPVLPFVLGPTAGPGTVVWASTGGSQFTSMNLVGIPEPSTIALGVLGLGSLLLIRRRK